MADGTLKVGTITTSSGSGTITIPDAVTVSSASLSNSPAFFSTGVSSSQALGNQTYTTLTNWNTPSSLLGSVTFSNGIYTLGTAGTYFFYAIPDIGNLADGDRAFVVIQASEDSFSSSSDISVNGKTMNASANADVTPQVSCIHTCTASTQVRVQAWQDYGGNRNFQGGYFMGYKLIG